MVILPSKTVRYPPCLFIYSEGTGICTLFKTRNNMSNCCNVFTSKSKIFFNNNAFIRKFHIPYPVCKRGSSLAVKTLESKLYSLSTFFRVSHSLAVISLFYQLFSLSSFFPSLSSPSPNYLHYYINYYILALCPMTKSCISFSTTRKNVWRRKTPIPFAHSW